MRQTKDGIGKDGRVQHGRRQQRKSAFDDSVTWGVPAQEANRSLVKVVNGYQVIIQPDEMIVGRPNANSLWLRDVWLDHDHQP